MCILHNIYLIENLVLFEHMWNILLNDQTSGHKEIFNNYRKVNIIEIVKS